MSMIISDDKGRDNEVDIDDDLLDDDTDDDDDQTRSKSKNRQGGGGGGSDDDTDDDEDEEPDDGWAAEVKRLRTALAKSNATGLRRRNQLKALRSAEQKADEDDDTDSDDEPDDGEKPKQKPSTGLDAKEVQRRVDKARRDERKKADQAHARDLIDTRAESALTRAGVSEKNVRLLKKELDYDELELLKDRTVDGLDEEIDRLRTEYPDFFRTPKGARRRINGGDDRDGKRKKPLSPTERQVRQLQGLE